MDRRDLTAVIGILAGAAVGAAAWVVLISLLARAL
jgi:hypothetical protein